MATDLHRMFGCPVCGFRITESEPTCPRCNNQFDSETKFECPFCGELVDPRVKECPVCHVDYAEFKAKTRSRGRDADIDDLLNEIIKLESMQLKQEPKKFSCPDCSWLLDGSESKCPKCGKDLSDEFAMQCPICGAPVSQVASSCAECGAKFDDEEAATPPTTAQPLINELEDFAATVKTSPPTIEPDKEPESPVSIERPITQPPEEPAKIEPPTIEQPALEVQEQEKPVEVVSEEPVEAAPVKPAAPKSKKRKLKAKSSAKAKG
jgi:rubrerythrin